MINPNNALAGLTGFGVSFGGTFLEMTNILTEIHGMVGILVDLGLLVVYITTAVFVVTQTIDLRDKVIERWKEKKTNKKK